MKGTDMLTIGEVAEIMNLPTNTITSYRSRGYMPKPDKQYGRTPLWKRSTIDKWLATRRDYTRSS